MLAVMWINEGHRPPQAEGKTFDDLLDMVYKSAAADYGVVSPPNLADPDKDLATTVYLANFVTNEGINFDRQAYSREWEYAILREERYIVSDDPQDLLDKVAGSRKLPHEIRDSLRSTLADGEVMALYREAQNVGLHPFIGFTINKNPFPGNVRQASYGTIAFMHPGYIPQGMSDGEFGSKVRAAFANVRKANRMQTGLRAR